MASPPVPLFPMQHEYILVCVCVSLCRVNNCVGENNQKFFVLFTVRFLYCVNQQVTVLQCSVSSLTVIVYNHFKFYIIYIYIMVSSFSAANSFSPQL